MPMTPPKKSGNFDWWRVVYTPQDGEASSSGDGNGGRCDGNMEVSIPKSCM